jgi:hypothetical protein
MKKYLHLIPNFFFVAFLITGCQDKIEVTRTYTLYEPVYMSMEEFRSAVVVQEPVEIGLHGKIYLYGSYILLNEPGKGIHIIDNKNPSKPTFIRFINIPGNFDMAVKGDILYADSYMDLVALDIGNINNITIIERLENIFPIQYSATFRFDQERGILVDWKEKETLVMTADESENFQNVFWVRDTWMAMGSGVKLDANAFAYMPTPSNASTGIGGSMARFTIVANYLYTLGQSKLYAFNISNLKQPKQESITPLGWGMETIFPYGKNLFIGSATGMFIYDISDPGTPKYVNGYTHVRSCDPVVVQDNLAFVTLRGGSMCGGFTNQLDVINIQDLYNLKLIKSYPMNGPYGLGIDGKTLFVCDGSAGLKVYDVSDVHNIDKNRIKTYSNINAYDVIPYNNLLIMIGKDGLHQFDYSNPSKMVFLSKIAIKKTDSK